MGEYIRGTYTLKQTSMLGVQEKFNLTINSPFRLVACRLTCYLCYRKLIRFSPIVPILDDFLRAGSAPLDLSGRVLIYSNILFYSFSKIKAINNIKIEAIVQNILNTKVPLSKNISIFSDRLCQFLEIIVGNILYPKKANPPTKTLNPKKIIFSVFISFLSLLLLQQQM